jgi:hypothetical protein
MTKHHTDVAVTSGGIASVADANERGPCGRAWLFWVVWIALPLGCAIVGYSYYNAARHPDSWHYHVFWIGMLTFMLPAGARLLSADPSRGERLQITAAFGLFAFVPKFLRDPSGPLWYDELAHWTQAEAIHAHRALFQPNPIEPIIQKFPGLEAVTDALRELSGASTFAAGSTLIALLHVSALLGVFFIAERLWDSPRIGGVAAIVYACNPGFILFDSQFAYESLGIVLFIWSVAAVVGIWASKRSPGGWTAAGVLIIAAVAPTHHITSYVTAGILTLAALFALARRQGRDDARNARYGAALATLAVATAAAWLLVVASSTIAYISPHVSGGISQTFHLIFQPSARRQLFQASTLPAYERASAFLAPLVAGAAVAVGLISLRRRASAPPALLALSVLALAYFPALPFFLSRAGNEGARRSLDFSYLGVAVLGAAALVRLATWSSHRGRATMLTGCAIAVAGVILLMGNIASGFDEEYRFPGPYVYGSDTRSQTAESRGIMNWFLATQGPNQHVVVDRYNGMLLASCGHQLTVTPSPAFPAWNLYFDSASPALSLLRQLRDSRDNYLVIDERMAQKLPLIGFYFVPNEPLAGIRLKPLSSRALDRYASLPWARNIYSSDTLKIYRLDFNAINLSGGANGG